MEEEIIEVGGGGEHNNPLNESVDYYGNNDSGDGDGFLFDSSVLDSLNKLTDEIQEDLYGNNNNADSNSNSDNEGDNEDGSDYDDSDDDYTDEDEDPDSGENQLFNMMDDLVMELQMELQDEDAVPEIDPEKYNDNPIGQADETSKAVAAAAADSAEEKRETVATPQSTPQKEDAVNVSAEEESTPSPSSKQSAPDIVPPTDQTNGPMSEYERAEKQRRLHSQVKMLLQRVSMMAEHAEAQESSSGHAVGAGRPRGDSGADKLERFLGALSSYSTAPGAASPRTATNTAPIPEGQAKTARAMSSYTQRKRREYLLRKQAASGGGANSSDGQRVTPVAVTPPSSKGDATATDATSNDQKKKKRRSRTNKHKKGKQKQTSPKMSELQYQQYMHHGYMQQQQDMQQQQQAYYAQQIQTQSPYQHHHHHHQEPIPQQSLRALLSQLLVLDERLSREEAIV